MSKLYTQQQVKSLLKKQTDFLDFPKVRRPYIVQHYCQNCGETLYSFLCCSSVWCPICNLRQAYKVNRQFREIDRRVGRETKRAFLTLTYKNTNKIDKQMFYRFRNSFTKKFIRYKRIREKVIGGIYAFDWTVSRHCKSAKFNIHIHSLIYLNDYLPQWLLSGLWRRATGGAYITHITEVKNISKAVWEVLKYIQSTSKLTKSNTNDREALVKAVAGIRRYSKFGIAYGMKVAKKKSNCFVCGGDMLTDWQNPLRHELFI